MSSRYEYKAFVSYSRADRGPAAALQTGLETFAKTTRTSRRYRVFRDEASLPVGGSLPERLREALAASEFLILVASPDAAQSPWVRQEVEEFLRGHTPDRLLVVLARGHLRWNSAAGNFARDENTAFPPLPAFTEEPLYLDLTGWTPNEDPRRRLEDALATLTAAITGQPKDELVGAHVKQYEDSRRRLRFNLAFRGLVSGTFVAALSILGTLFLQNIGAGVLMACALAGASVAFAVGLRWHSILVFAVTFAIAGFATLLAGIQPFRRDATEVIGMLLLQVLVFGAAGTLGGRRTKGLRVRQTAILFAGVAALANAVLIAGASKRPFALAFPIFAAPWFPDRLFLAAASTFSPPENFDFVWLLVLCSVTAGLLGGVVGLEHARVELPPRNTPTQASSKVAGLMVRTAAGVGALAILVLLITWKPMQKRAIAKELSASVYRSHFSHGIVGVSYGTEPDEIFASALRARNALRSSGFEREANDLSGLISEWIAHYVRESGGYPGSFEDLGNVAPLFVSQGEAGELEALMGGAEQKAKESLGRFIGFAHAVAILGDPYPRRKEILDRLEARRSEARPRELGKIANVLDSAGRKVEAERTLRDALERAEALRQGDRKAADDQLDDADVADLVWRYNLWDSLPESKLLDFNVEEVARAMGRTGAWDRAAELAEKDPYGHADMILADVAGEAVDKGDFAAAFRVFAALDQRHHDLALKAHVLRRIVEGARAGGGATAPTVIATAKRKAELIIRALPLSSDNPNNARRELARLAIAAGDDPDRNPQLQELREDVEGAVVQIELAEMQVRRDNAGGTKNRLRRAWLAVHSEEHMGREQCRAIARLSSQFIAIGKLTSARVIANECGPGVYQTHPILRLNVLADAMVAWEGGKTMAPKSRPAA
jgi:hypothetical protein